MPQNQKSFFSVKILLFDALLTIGFLLWISGKLRPLVPAHTEFYAKLFALFGGVCLSGVFFLAVQMFRVTLKDQLRRRTHINKKDK